MLNADGADPLLDALRREHSEPRYDIARVLLAHAARVTARRRKLAAAAA